MHGGNFLEIEAKFLSVDKNDIRKKLIAKGAFLVRGEYDQKRANFYLPTERLSSDKWLRVRDDAGVISLSFKEITGEGIEDQKEISIVVDDFVNTVQLLESIGCKQKSLIFTKRELWRFMETDITIDSWPFLDNFIEVEGISKEAVKRASEMLGFSFSDAVFGAVGKLYKDKYGVSLDEIEESVGDITFDNKKMEDFLASCL